MLEEKQLKIQFNFIIEIKKKPVFHKKAVSHTSLIFPIRHCISYFDSTNPNQIKNYCYRASQGSTTAYTTRNLVDNRKLLEQTIYKAIRERLGGMCCRPNCSSYAHGAVSF